MSAAYDIALLVGASAVILGLLGLAATPPRRRHEGRGPRSIP